LLGGTAGLLIAFSARRFLLNLFPNNIANLSIPTVENIPIDWAVIAFTLAGTLLTAVIFGFVPLLRSGSRNLGQVLQRATRGSTEASGSRRFQSLLVVTEIALSFTLMIGALLLIRSFVQLTQRSLGFQPEGVLALEAFPSQSQYPAKDPKKLQTFIDQSIANLSRVPGVESASAVNFLPLTGFWGQEKFTIEGRPLPSPGAEPVADEQIISPDYFSTMQIPLLRGRPFTAGDDSGAPRVVIVSESLARRFFGTADAIGMRLNLGSVEKPEVSQVVGVVGDIHAFGIAEKAHDYIYQPFAQVYFPVIAFTVRTKGAPESIIPQAKAAIWKIDPQQPFFKVITVDELASESIALRRSSMLLLGAFSAIALALAIVGIYGVLSYSVAQRTREIGVRTAMGASSGDVLRLIFKDGVRLIVPGVAAGLAISILLARTVSSLLVGVAPTDLSTFAGTTVLVVTSALAACYLPARRAAAVDPINALRYE
jgi:putative ABC transport system permease protein